MLPVSGEEDNEDGDDVGRKYLRERGTQPEPGNELAYLNTLGPSPLEWSRPVESRRFRTGAIVSHR